MDAIRFLNVEYIYTRLISLFWNFDIVAFLNAVIHTIEFLIPFGITISLFLILVILYAKMRLKQMAKEDEEKKAASKNVAANVMTAKGAAPAGVATVSVASSGPDNLPGAEVVATDTSNADLDLHNKWQLVQKNISSDNPSDWRVAIMEADIMLGDVLTKRGYRGDTIGDQLKSVDPSDMLTLQDAWAVHKVRNNVAHGGSDFKINEREARATIDAYKKVFEEFYHI